MYSLVVSGAGAALAAVGSGVLLARCFRDPRGDLIAWSVALLGLLMSLGAQALGHLSGFDAAMFRAMELGGQVIAPLALIIGLSEVAAKSMAARFCARLYIPALAIIATVVLALDQLASKPFSKAWPDPALHYQTPPAYVLFAVGLVTVAVTITAVGTVVYRSGQPGWNAVLSGQLMAGTAAIALAYPAIAQLLAYLGSARLPVGSAFSLLCALAAGLTWLAGTRTGQLRLDTLRGQGSRRSRAADLGWEADDGDLEPSGAGPGAARYRGGGSHRSGAGDANATRRYGRDGESGYDWQDDRVDGGYADDWYRGDPPGGRRRDGYRSDYESGELASPDFATGGFASAAGDLSPDFADADGGYPPGRWHSAGRGDDYRGPHEPPDQAAHGGRRADGNGAPDRYPASARSGDEAARSQLFGQIAIYTLLEDRVAEFDQLTERVVDLVRGREPDTLVYIVHAVPSAPMQRILYEVYRDRSAYERHGQQPYVLQFEADRRPYVLATNVIELGLQQAKVSPFPSVAELFGEPGYDTSGFERPDYLRDYGRPQAQPGSGSREYR